MKMTLITIFCLSIVLNTYADDKSLSKLVNEVAQLKKESLASSPELKIVESARNQKLAESYTRFTQFLPQANLEIKKQKDFFEERNIQLRALGLTPMNANWSINYQWSLLNYNAIESSRKTWREKDKTQLALELKIKEYPIAFTTSLLNFLLSKYKRATVENSLKKAETGKKEAKLGFELGQKTKIDVLRSEANWVSLDSKKTTFLDEEQNARSKFLEFSGLQDHKLNFLDNLDEELILNLINSLTHSEMTIDLTPRDQSPLIQSLEYEEKINALTLSQLTSAQMPELSIQGSYSNSGDDIKDTLHSPYRTHAVALVLTIPIFGGGNFASSHFEEYFAKKQNEYSIAQKKLETHNQLHNTSIKIKALEKMVTSLQLNVSQFEELYRLTQKSYQLGRSSLFELLEVQDNLLDSKINLAQTKINYYTLSQNYLWQAGIE